MTVDKREVATDRFEIEKQAIVAGTHPDFIRRKLEIEQIRQQRLREAEIRKKMRIEETEALYTFSKTAADKDFQDSEAQLRETMLSEVHTRKELNRLVSSDGYDRKVGGSRVLRSKAKEKEEDEEGNDGSGPPGFKSGISDVDAVPLALDDQKILSDLDEIYESMKANAESNRMETEEEWVIVESLPGRSPKLTNGLLEIVFGDKVVAKTVLTGDEFSGTVSSINSKAKEIELSLLDSMTARVPLAHLNAGRIILTRRM